jgi:DnaJ-class molecular chaperone
MHEKVCRTCKGKGTVEGGNIRGICAYCRGRGFKYNKYGADPKGDNFGGGKDETSV